MRLSFVVNALANGRLFRTMDNFDIMNEVGGVESSYTIPLLNSTLIPMLLLSLATQKHSPNTKRYFWDEYDYIVVGAGSAGAVIASRLSEIPCISVLLLEAGKAPPILTEVPAFVASFIGGEANWDYYTVPQKYTAKGFPGRRIRSPRGKMLGGSSSHNENQYLRGNRKDYDLWAAEGATGWSYDEVLPYFMKMEDNVVPELVANGFHGVCGPITVSLPTYDHEVKAPLFEAHRAQGLKENDPNGPTQTGSYKPQETSRFGQRCSTAKGYLVPKENAPNLDIIVNAFVTKVIIEDLKATGVQFDFEGQSYEVAATKEVILSAGAFNTPQLLMLSGVGPAAHLEDLGVPVLSDLSVGLNLQDHFSVLFPFELNSEFESLEEKLSDEKYLKEYIDHRTGPLSVQFGLILGSFVNDVPGNEEVDFPPLQFFISQLIPKAMKGSLTKKVYKQVFAPYENKTIAACYVAVLHPKTRGSIKLRSIDPYDPPIIDLQYLEDPADLEVIVEGMKFCKRVITSPAMRRVGTKMFSTVFPGCESELSNDDSYFRCVAGLITSTEYNPVGTAKMGALEDETTVVDPQLRVKTIAGLRVVDASVMPKIVGGTTNAPTIMIAEKAADMIKETITCRT